MRAITDLSGHPLAVLRALQRRYGDRLVVGFSRYRYRRRVREDVRESFRVPIHSVDRRWLAVELGQLAEDQELALESRVWQGKTLRHIPMLDFVGLGRGQLHALTQVLPRNSLRSVQIYASGRSFHAYYPVLVTPQEWIQFMGSALLCNTPSRRIVDDRWIGHRLLGGYGALRWSWNTGIYRAMPRRVSVARTRHMIG